MANSPKWLAVVHSEATTSKEKKEASNLPHGMTRDWSLAEVFGRIFENRKEGHPANAG
jgi:hypothetical protein